MAGENQGGLLRATLAAAAPGTELREGLERILRGRTGALIVLGWDDAVKGLCTGGFAIDAAFSATRLRELAKMDGAIILDSQMTRIHRAAVHLVPDSDIETEESGTRHRTAQRVSRETGYPVVSVSQSMQIVAVYIHGLRRVLEAPESILGKANQALATLERYRARLDEVSGTLSTLEIEDLVTVRDVATVAQRMEMVRRIANEIEEYVIELGTEGRLVSLQLEELVGGMATERGLVMRDYFGGSEDHEESMQLLASLDASELVDLDQIARVLRLVSFGDSLDLPVSPRGYRLLSRIPRLPMGVVERLVEHFDGLQRLLSAGVEDLMQVEGVGELRARAIREGLSRLAESSIMERYV